MNVLKTLKLIIKMIKKEKENKNLEIRNSQGLEANRAIKNLWLVQADWNMGLVWESSLHLWSWISATHYASFYFFFIFTFPQVFSYFYFSLSLSLSLVYTEQKTQQKMKFKSACLAFSLSVFWFSNYFMVLENVSEENIMRFGEFQCLNRQNHRITR